MQEVKNETGVVQVVWKFIKDFLYIYFKFVLYAIAIYILFYYYDMYFS